ncbi:MAG TPA: glycoside hydrolase family 20 zincin-like fold domain-containing protein, partial [Verrucomicrobiae bacterium]|nr:glycoside hydrolase family 20 zincin-like fold domain-containing protein [Verrucomicrobiae bacterium]
MKTNLPIFILVLCLAARVCVAQADSPAIIPLPQKMELRSGTFKLTPETKIVADSASLETARYLAARLRKSTGYPLRIVNSESNGADEGILLTTQNAKSDLAPEGYQLDVAPDSVGLRAPTQAGLFYGVQTLSQLFPPEIFSSN